VFQPHIEEDRLAVLRHDAAPAGSPSPEEEGRGAGDGRKSSDVCGDASQGV
jgi:hypothetical protein